MLPCHSSYVYGTWRSKKIGVFKVIVWREAEGGKPESQGEHFSGRSDLSGILSELTTYFSLFWSNKSSMIGIT